MTVMPPVSPVLVKRRFTPRNPAKALRMVASSTSISMAMAMAARAFCTLCAPSIGRRNGPILRVRLRNRSVSSTSNVAPSLSITIRSARTSACGLKP